jgi:hypothetical protein
MIRTDIYAGACAPENSFLPTMNIFLTASIEPCNSSTTLILKTGQPVLESVHITQLKLFVGFSAVMINRLRSGLSGFLKSIDTSVSKAGQLVCVEIKIFFYQNSDMGRLLTMHHGLCFGLVPKHTTFLV